MLLLPVLIVLPDLPLGILRYSGAGYTINEEIAIQLIDTVSIAHLIDKINFHHEIIRGPVLLFAEYHLVKSSIILGDVYKFHILISSYSSVCIPGHHLRAMEKESCTPNCSKFSSCFSLIISQARWEANWRPIGEKQQGLGQFEDGPSPGRIG